MPWSLLAIHARDRRLPRRARATRRYAATGRGFPARDVPANWWTRPAIADLLPVVQTFERPRRQIRSANALEKACDVRRNVVEHPVNPHTLRRSRVRRVGVIHDQRQALRALGNPRPLQGRGSDAESHGKTPARGTKRLGPRRNTTDAALPRDHWGTPPPFSDKKPPRFTSLRTSHHARPAFERTPRGVQAGRAHRPRVSACQGPGFLRWRRRI